MFWFASRYPQLFSKADHVGQALPSMAYTSQLVVLAEDAPVWQRILASAVNWLDSMKIGMTFGVLFGAWLHTVLRYYPLKIGKNLYLNSLKGALVGVPMGVCATVRSPRPAASPVVTVGSRSPWGSCSVRRTSTRSSW